MVFDRICDSMWLNKISRTSSREIGPHHQKYSSIFLCTHEELFIRSHQTNLESLLLKSSLFSFIWPIWSSSRVWQLNMLEMVFWWKHFLFLIFFLKPSQTICAYVGAVWSFLRFADTETQPFSAILQLWSLNSLWPLKFSSSPCIRTIKTCPLPGRFITFSVDSKFLIIALMEEMGISLL